MRDLGDGTVTILILQFKVVWKQFCQIQAVIVIVLVDIPQGKDQPVAENHSACLTDGKRQKVFKKSPKYVAILEFFKLK
ncbi:MAG: hypothetical protein AB2L24_00580 [Mangrovibacterium sp.]